MKNKIIATIIAALLLPVSISLVMVILMLVAKYDWIAWTFAILMCTCAAYFIYPVIKKKINDIDKQRKQQ